MLPNQSQKNPLPIKALALTPSHHHKLKCPLTQNSLHYPIHVYTYIFPKNHCCTELKSLYPFIPSYLFPLLFVIMKPLILIYYYYDESHNDLDTVEVFPYVDLIIIRKTYDFYHVNTFINLSDVYRWRSVIFTAEPFFLLCTCYNGQTSI